ncbi:hypothetical protein [Clostridium septicum]|uniref:hypothetical protein n=1 Tax=Clostridium septicum TaxID=1504 RepID=UPI000FF8B986|nr:hypothetical protein [Clostridium septicum]QAS61951.1 hypothetical protein EI377_15105 [Clostridium septicum]
MKGIYYAYKKQKNIFIITVIVIISVLFIFKSNTLYESTSPNNENIIIVNHSNSFLFGNNSINIISRRTGFTNFLNSSKYKTSILNDGKNLNESNINISWSNDDTALITLTGEKQNPELITVKFSTDIIYK